MSTISIIKSALTRSLALTLAVATLGYAAYFALEPAVSRAVVDDFTITQVVTAEISFMASTTDVVMSPSIAGLTGGISSGTTTVRVSTNNPTGYNMTLKFASTTANAPHAMNGNTQGGYIDNYTPASAGVPDYGFSTAANTTEFAYTVAASTTSDLDTSFRNNGSNACNDAGGGDVDFNCWMAPSTTPTGGETIVNRNAETPASGATTSIAFRLQINSNPARDIPADTYVATATLTAVTN